MKELCQRWISAASHICNISRVMMVWLRKTAHPPAQSLCVQFIASVKQIPEKELVDLSSTTGLWCHKFATSWVNGKWNAWVLVCGSTLLPFPIRRYWVKLSFANEMKMGICVQWNTPKSTRIAWLVCVFHRRRGGDDVFSQLFRCYTYTF